MLNKLEQKVVDDGKKEDEEFDRFMCYCKTNARKLSKSIADAQAKLPSLQSTIKEGVAELQRLKGENAEAKRDLASAKDALSRGQELRKKGAEAYAKKSAHDEASIKAMSSAIKSLKSGKGGSFLESSAADTIRSLSLSRELSASAREVLSSFLSGASTASTAEEEDDADGEAAPSTDEVVGLLSQMRETMERDLKDAHAAEKRAKADFQSMADAKANQIDALVRTSESTASRVGALAEELVNQRNQLDDTQKGFVEDTAFQSTLTKQCEDRKVSHASSQQTRTEESLALSETSKMLSEDSARDLFKKTVAAPSVLQLKVTDEGDPPSFLQMQVTSEDVRQEALQVLHEVRKRGKEGGPHDARLDLLALALRSKRVGFDKVLEMVDQMVGKLGDEQQRDDQKKDWCLAELNKAKGHLKGLQKDSSDLKKVISEGKQKLKADSEEINALLQGLKDLDQMVAEATRQRKEDHRLSAEKLATNSAAKELLRKAKDRLQSFYNPRLARGTSAVQEEEKAESDEDDPQYQKKNEESTGIVEMISNLQAMMDKEMQTTEIQEKQAQAEYEMTVKESAKKRAAGAKAIANLESIKAMAEEQLHKLKKQRGSKEKEVEATEGYKLQLHSECDFLLSRFKIRRELRAGEIDALKRSKAVLSGAGYSFLQMRSSRSAFLR